MQIGGSEAVLIVGSVALAAIVNELIKVWFAKMRSTDYVSKESCKECKGQEAKFGEHRDEKIDAIAQLVLAMAIKMGVDTKDILPLLK